MRCSCSCSCSCSFACVCVCVVGKEEEEQRKNTKSFFLCDIIFANRHKGKEKRTNEKNAAIGGANGNSHGGNQEEAEEKKRRRKQNHGIGAGNGGGGGDSCRSKTSLRDHSSHNLAVEDTQTKYEQKNKTKRERIYGF